MRAPHSQWLAVAGEPVAGCAELHWIVFHSVHARGRNFKLPFQSIYLHLLSSPLLSSSFSLVSSSPGCSYSRSSFTMLAIRAFSKPVSRQALRAAPRAAATWAVYVSDDFAPTGRTAPPPQANAYMPAAEPMLLDRRREGRQVQRHQGLRCTSLPDQFLSSLLFPSLWQPQHRLVRAKVAEIKSLSLDAWPRPRIMLIFALLTPCPGQLPRQLD